MLPLWDELPEDPSEAMAELIPISWPLALTRAPPLLPGLIAALVWIALVTTGSPEDCCCCPKGSLGCWSDVLTGLLRALTMPVVTVPARHKGLPTAITGSPTVRALASPSAMALRSPGALVSLMTARSVVGGVGTNVAGKV